MSARPYTQLGFTSFMLANHSLDVEKRADIKVINSFHSSLTEKSSSNESRRYINIMSVHLCNWMMVETYRIFITLDSARPGQRMPRIEIKWAKEGEGWGRKRYTIYLFCSPPSISLILFHLSNWQNISLPN